MKPENAKRIVMSSDLTVTSLIHSQEQIQKSMEPEYKNRLHWSIQVPSQLMGEAVKIGFLLGYGMEVDFTYERDEWSLTGYRFDTEDNKFEYVSETIWSPGA